MNASRKPVYDIRRDRAKFRSTANRTLDINTGVYVPRGGFRL